MYFQCWKSTRRREKLFVLWALFSIQLLLIGIFVLFGTATNDIDDDSLQAYKTDEATVDGKFSKIVKFVKNNNLDISSLSNQASTRAPLINSAIILEPLQTFRDAYFECHSGDAPSNFSIDALYCFRNGSVLPVSSFLRKMSDWNEEQEDCVCKCQVGYHGRDCSQPEVVWRAFITASSRSNGQNTIDESPLVQKEPKANRIYYLIESTALSLTTIEIQFMELDDLVDLYVLCDETRNGTTALHGVSSKHDQFRYHQQSVEHGTNYFLKRMKSKILILETRHKCTPKQMYKLFRHRMDAAATAQNADASTLLNANDILLYSSYDEILNRQAIQYLKWNTNWSQSQPIRFRLKYTVYGFYWQHPMQTKLSSIACELHVIDELYDSDPLLAMKNTKTTTGMIIGDLNHYGGWFCQYCYESSVNILQKVQRDRMLNLQSPTNGGMIDKKLITNDVEQPSQQHQATQFDASYVESLVSAGVYVDEKLNLMRLHRYTDKYYAPDSVIERSWKYESLLTNTYAHYDGDIEE